MDEQLLPKHIISRAHITLPSEYSWKKEDIEEVIEAARSIGLASLGGQVQFITPYGVYELYWLNYNSQDQVPGETWASYVDRCASEVIVEFRRLCANTDFRQVAGDFEGHSRDNSPG